MQTIGRMVAPHGLIVLGAFHPEPDQTVVIIGNLGRDLWAAFAARTDSLAKHPLDDWTRATLTPIAIELGSQAVFPFDGPPYAPFQAWAIEAGIGFSSPIGPLIHPIYGLWHAYRAAFLFETPLSIPKNVQVASPCMNCPDKRCLSACPVSAFSERGYNVPACLTHLGSSQGRPCMEDGCAARHACPVGQDYAYPPAMANFHMRKFVDLYGGLTD